jgi:predicted CXXCH cytochrome family protein
VKRKKVQTKETDTGKGNKRTVVNHVASFRFTFFYHVSHFLVTFFIALFMLSAAAEGTTSRIINTKHNLSASGPGDIKALSETRICVFCHTPHNGAPQTPLWNKSIQPVTYNLYESTTLKAPLKQPYGPTRLCLSCHDGTVALGAVLNPSEGVSMTMGSIPPGRPSYLGTNLGGDHPVSFSYDDSLAAFPDPLGIFEINPTPPAGLLFYGSSGVYSSVHCTTCHDPHEDAFQSPDKNNFLTGKFLLMNNSHSALCTACHNTAWNGWSASVHSTSTSPVNNVLPITPRIWPTWTTVSQWGCEGCHTAHNAGSQQRLLYYANEENNCYTCHNGSVAQKNIYTEFQKISHHKVEYAKGVHDPTESPVQIINHVECVDCHNAHAVNATTATAPNVSGRLTMVSGVNTGGAPLSSAAHEYEICFKCHADSVPSIPFSTIPVQRVITSTNTRQQFNTLNASYHPVVDVGKTPANVPSVTFSQYVAGIMTGSSIIYCMDCHESDDSSGIPGAGYSGPRGPHGSQYVPLLREQYLISDFTPESQQNYALCYRCHDRTTVLNQSGSSGSWIRHYDHIVTDSAPCSACHDPHGIYDISPGTTGTHTRLINFDATIVLPAPGNTYPLFTSMSPGSGSCTLVCHGVTHGAGAANSTHSTNSTYP